MQWLELTIQTASSGIEALGAHLTAQGYDSFVIDDQIEYEAFLENNRAYWDYIDEELEKRLQGLSQIKLYLEMDGREQEKVETLKASLEALRNRLPNVQFGSLAVTAAPMAEENWEDSWKENYPPQPVGNRLVVLPYWLADTDASGRIPVVLDPGLTFGTGAHPSTQMCMEALEERLLPGSRVIDLGSGSGILSIAALRLGAKEAICVDIDPKAEGIAEENAAYNGFGRDVFRACTGNVSEDTPLMRELCAKNYDVVLINIVADVILSLLPALHRLLQRETIVICSDILDTRLPEIYEGLKEAGLQVLETKAKEDWRCVVAKEA